MRNVLILLLLIEFTLNAFEPGERMILQMKPGIKAIPPFYNSEFIKSILGIDQSLKDKFSHSFDINSSVYNAIFKDVNKTDLFKHKKFYHTLSKSLEENATYWEKMNKYKSRCTNESSLDEAQKALKESSLDKALDKALKESSLDKALKDMILKKEAQSNAEIVCGKLKDDLNTSRINIFKSKFPSSAEAENKGFIEAKQKLLEKIYANINFYKKEHPKMNKNLEDAKIFLKQYVFVQKLKYITGYDIENYNDLYTDVINENTNNKLLSSLSPTLVEGFGQKLHVNLYRGRLSNRRIPITLKAAAVNYNELNQNDKMMDTLMDYSGGLLNLRIDIFNALYAKYDRQTDYKYADYYGTSLQVGAKYDIYPSSTENNESNSTQNHLTPYVSFVAQTDWNLFSNKKLLEKEGYLLTGFNLSYQYLDKDFRNTLGIDNRNLYTWEVYAKFYISEKFGLKVNYAQAFSQARDVLDSRTYISFDIEP